MGVSTIMVDGQAVDQSVLQDTTSDTYKQVEAVLIAEMRKVYEEAGIPLSDLDISSIEFQETVNQFVASFDAITEAGIELSSAELNSTVSSAFKDLMGTNTFDDAFGEGGVSMSFVGASDVPSATGVVSNNQQSSNGSRHFNYMSVPVFVTMLCITLESYQK